MKLEASELAGVAVWPGTPMLATQQSHSTQTKQTTPVVESEFQSSQSTLCKKSERNKKKMATNFGIYVLG